MNVLRAPAPVLKDMDGVLAGFDDAVLSHLKQNNPEIELTLERPNFYIADDYSPEHQEVIKAITTASRFFAALPVVEYALEGWGRTIALGYEPRICTSPLTSNPTCSEEKLEWLEQHFVPRFGKKVVEQAVITSHKHEVDGIALIDDRPEIRRAHEATWQHIIFDRPFNRYLADSSRLYGWLDPNYPDLLARAAEQYKGREI